MMRFIIPVSCALLVGSGAVAQVNAPATQASDLAHSLNDAFADVYQKVSPGVVVIEVEEAAGDSVDNLSPLYEFFMQDPGGRPRRQRTEINQGSGFLLSSNGYILTNGHVVEGAAEDGIQVQLNDGRKFQGTLVGVDKISDLAVLKIDAKNLPVVELGDSDRVRVGQFAFALGAPFDLRYSFTYGIISAKGRSGITDSKYYEEFLQTDASINPGNSGGPLVDIDGRVIGINTLIRDINRGLGFAIPINQAKKIASQLIQNGHAVRPYVGLAMSSDEEYEAAREDFPSLPEAGVIVEGVDPSSPAASSGLEGAWMSRRGGYRIGDVIVGVDGKPAHSAHEIQKAILDKEVGDEVVLDVWRDNRVRKVSIRTAEQTDGILRAANNTGHFGPAPRQAPPAQSAKPSGTPSAAGLTVKTVTPDVAVAMSLSAEQGVLVTAVDPGSPAEVAGLESGDVITSIASQPVRTEADVARLLDAAKDEGVMVNYTRGNDRTYAILKP